MLQIKTFQFSPIQENTYVVYNEEKDCIIFDPGCYFQEEKEALDDFIKSHQLVPKLLINTHCHLDHVFGNKFVAETYHLKPFIHPLEEKLLALAPTSGLMYNLPFDHYSGELQYLKEGQVISLGEDQLKVLFTPGHSPGSVSFYCEKQSWLISGDVLFYQSIGRTDLPGGDLETLLASIRKEIFVLPDETIVYSGHGQETTVGEEKRHNPFLR